MIGKRLLKLNCLVFFIIGVLIFLNGLKWNVHAGGMKMLAGQVLDVKGRPASQYPIIIESVGSHLAQKYITVTDFSGIFQVYNLPPGEYQVYPVNQPPEVWKSIEVKGEPLKWIEPLILREQIFIKINPDIIPGVYLKQRS